MARLICARKVSELRCCETSLNFLSLNDVIVEVQKKKIKTIGDLKNIILEKSPYGFDDMMDDYEVPFDCNEFWDKKQWYWLEQNIENLKGKTLFWNIGGSYLKSIGKK